MRSLLRAILEGAGFAVIEAADGEEALRAALSRPLAAMLLDVHLPGMSGLEVLERLRAEPAGSTVPVLLVTGDDDTADRVRGLRAGANDYVTKPFEPEELLARIEAHLRRQEAWAEVVERQLEERAEIARALGRVDPLASPEQVANEICQEVREFRHPGGIAIVAFASDGVGLVLAAADLDVPGLETGRSLPHPVVEHLVDRSAGGPWVERLDADSSGGLPASPLQTGMMLACAPLHRGDELLGVLLLTAALPHTDPPPRAGAAALATAIDVAGMASGLLASAVLGRRRQRARLARLLGIMRARAFGPVFQPIVRLSDLEVVGYEALTRFADGTPPDLRFAEATGLGLGPELELAAAGAALDSARILPDDAWVSLNVSARLIVASSELAPLLDAADRPVVLEVTEHDRVDDYDRLRRALAALGPQVRLSVDDAGSGFATLRHVLALEPAFVKLDRAWVTGIEDDPAKQALVAGLSHFAARTGCGLIAEGIETEGELTVLQDLEAHFGQGFLFGLPSRAAPAHG